MLKIGVKHDLDKREIDEIKWDNLLVGLEQRVETKHNNKKNKKNKKRKKCNTETIDH